MSSLSCTDPILPCNCSAGTECIQVPRQGDVCAKNVCASSSTTASSSSSSIGGTVGGALGGVCGILAALGLLYWFWWKPRGLAASRKRYSRHLSSRQSKIGDRKSSDGHMGTDNGTATKRSSVHLNMEGVGTTTTRRAGPRDSTDTGLPASVRATAGGTPRASIDSENPFGDHARSSMATFADASSTRTSDFSFRSSHSTNIIPIAYIPPHSGSLSVEDGVRGPYGESLLDPHRDSRRSSKLRNSIPLSIDSRNSVVPSASGAGNGNSSAGHERRESLLLSATSAEHPSILHSAGGAPIRPPRSPGLDLKLPAPITSPLASAHFPDNRQSMRPASGFPWEPSTSGAGGADRPNLESKFSSSTTTGRKGNGESRGMSALLEAGESPKAGSHMSTFSVMTTSSNRSGQSTMSYILDPPQIITPVNTQGLRRVEVLGRGQAGLVRIGGSGLPTSTPGSPLPTTPLATSTTADELAGTGATELVDGETTHYAEEGATDPFVDSPEATPLSGRFSAVGAQGIVSLSPDEQRDQNTETGSRARPVTNESLMWAPSNRNTTSTLGARESSDARSSYASSAGSTGSSSMLDGIPFLTTPITSPNPNIHSAQRILIPGSDTAHHSPPLPIPSPLFPKPLEQMQRQIQKPPQSIVVQPATPVHDASFSVLDSSVSSSSIDHTSSTLFSSTSSTYPPSSNTTYSLTPHSPPSKPHSFLSTTAITEELSTALPTPFLPFAGQRPSSTTSLSSVNPSSSSNAGNKDRVQSQALSIRSGYGSGLSQIPFQIGGIGEFGGSERGSVISAASSRNSRMFEEGEEDYTGPLGEEDNPFGKQAEVGRAEGAGADARASIDTLQLSAMLSSQLGDEI